MRRFNIMKDGLEQQDEVDGTKTFAGVRFVILQRLNCGVNNRQ